MSALQSHSRYVFREPGRIAPGLALAQSFWALLDRELSVEKSLELEMQKGLTYFEAGLREERMPTIRRIVERYPVQFIAQGWAVSLAEAEPFFDRAVELGAKLINMHLGHAHLSLEESTRLVDAVVEKAEQRGLFMALETHRGRLTQDLYRTSALLSYRPQYLITLDVSHYIVAGESLGGDPVAFHRDLLPLLKRTALIHGRVSNGACIQVDDRDEFAFVADTRRIWQRTMELWLADAPPDAVLVFEPELGPSPYAYRDSTGLETFSRTDASARLAQIARLAWDAAYAKHLCQTISSTHS